MKNSKRLEWLDLARGWAMALVILAHTPIPTKLSSYIYSFHVPLFFIISGFLLHSGLKKTPAEFIKNKFTRLVIPYLFFSLIGYIYWLITRSSGWDMGAASIDPSVPLNGTLMAIRGGNFMTHNAALWFICSLFVSEIAFYGIWKLVKGDKLLLVVGVVLSGIVGILYNTFSAAPLPWSIDTLPIVVVFLGLGFFIKEFYPKWTKAKKNKYVEPVVFACALLVSLSAWYFNKISVGTVDMYYGIYGSFPLYFLAALSGSIAVMVVFENFIPKLKILSYMGKNSLIIYALHQKVIFGIIGIISFYLLGRTTPFLLNDSLGKIENGLTYLIATLLILVPAIWLLNKYCAPVIGKGWGKSGRREKTSAEIS